MKVYVVASDEDVKGVFADKEPAEEYAELLRGYYSVTETDLLQNVYKIHEYWEFEVSGREYGCSINIIHRYTPLPAETLAKAEYYGTRVRAGCGRTPASAERAKEMAGDMLKTYLADMTNPSSEKYGLINDTSPLLQMHTSAYAAIPAHTVNKEK